MIEINTGDKEERETLKGRQKGNSLCPVPGAFGSDIHKKY